jgi:hypothetical protein
LIGDCTAKSRSSQVRTYGSKMTQKPKTRTTITVRVGTKHRGQENWSNYFELLNFPNGFPTILMGNLHKLIQTNHNVSAACAFKVCRTSMMRGSSFHSGSDRCI